MHSNDQIPIRDIRDRASLATACRDWLRHEAIGLDTEFVRETTYEPVPGLIQVSDDAHCWLVDPQAVDDLEPLFEVLANDQPVKIMHSASQDLELFRVMGAASPRALFDTQLAAMLAGIGDSPSYAALVREVLGTALEKGETRSDWTRRPLTAAQRRYAARDVFYLPPLYRRLHARLDELGRASWLVEECDRLVVEAWRDEPALASRRQRQAWRLEPREQTLLAALWSWREAQARELNRPRQRVLDDQRLVELVRSPPRNRDDLGRAGQKPGWIRRFGDALIREISAVLDRSDDDFPVRFPPPPRTPDEKTRLKALQRAVRDLSAQTGVPAGLLVTRHTLDRLATGASKLSDLPENLRGWRESVVVPVLAEALEAVSKSQAEG